MIRERVVAGRKPFADPLYNGLPLLFIPTHVQKLRQTPNRILLELATIRAQWTDRAWITFFVFGLLVPVAGIFASFDTTGETDMDTIVQKNFVFWVYL